MQHRPGTPSETQMHACYQAGLVGAVTVQAVEAYPDIGAKPRDIFDRRRRPTPLSASHDRRLRRLSAT